jgi:hypothetical protein
MEDKLVYSYSDGELLCSVLGKRKGKGLADERSRWVCIRLYSLEHSRNILDDQFKDATLKKTTDEKIHVDCHIPLYFF